MSDAELGLLVDGREVAEGDVEGRSDEEGAKGLAVSATAEEEEGGSDEGLEMAESASGVESGGLEGASLDGVEVDKTDLVLDASDLRISEAHVDERLEKSPLWSAREVDGRVERSCADEFGRRSSDGEEAEVSP